MKRAALGAITGYLVWSALWLGGNAGIAQLYSEEAEAFREGEPYTRSAPLLVALVLSVLCSAVAGWTAASVGRAAARGAALAMVLGLLLTGIAVQASVWSQMPLWYHLVFLALIAPVCMATARTRPA